MLFLPRPFLSHIHLPLLTPQCLAFVTSNVPYVHNWRVHGRFYGLDLKGDGHLGKLAIDTLVLSMMKKMAAD